MERTEILNVGDEVICTENNRDVVQGDVLVIIIPSTPCCGGFIAKDRQHHYKHKYFEKFNRDKTACEHIPIENNTVPMETVVKAMVRLMLLLAHGNHNGFVSSDAIREEISYQMKRMGVEKQYNELWQKGALAL